MSIRRRLIIALAFYVAYLLLDWLSYIHPLQTLGITPWNPQPALAIALVASLGPRWIPIVFAAILSAEFVVRGAAVNWTAAIVVSGVLTGGYAAIARALTNPFRVDRSLPEAPDVVRLIGVVIAGALATAALYVGALLALGIRLEESAVAATLKFWIGDSVGILVTLPLLFMLTDRARRAALVQLWHRRETLLQLLAILAALWVVFRWVGPEPFKYFYLLFLPLIWVAARDGLPGAVLAVALIQSGIIVGVQVGGTATLTVFELQAVQIALTITGLFLGVVVDERERAARALRQSTRLAAAGSMAAALAHELNQPLTALSGYAKAAQLLAVAQPFDAARLDGALRKLIGEARRAADVLQKVREFFQTGEPHPSDVDMAELVHAVLDSLQPVAAKSGVALERYPDGVSERLWIDRLQFEVVLRNLLANAIDAAAEASTLPRKVSIRMSHGADTWRLSVEDSGTGVAAEFAEAIFEPFFTRKATGMGMGLAISRAIVRAHGGRLEVVPGPHGVFVLELPRLRRPLPATREALS